MIQNFTPNDVLKFQSGELSETEQNLFQLARLEDAGVSDFAEIVMQLESQMASLISAPSEKPYQNIMAFLSELETVKE